jgi:hypothetical protein
MICALQSQGTQASMCLALCLELDLWCCRWQNLGSRKTGCYLPRVLEESLGGLKPSSRSPGNYHSEPETPNLGVLPHPWPWCHFEGSTQACLVCILLHRAFVSFQP